MSQPTLPSSTSANLEITAGAAIIAPAAAFQGALPANALVVVPLTQPKEELKTKLKDGAVAVTKEQMWELLGFNGPAVTVQDQQGRPITLGLEDLLASLRKNFTDNPKDLNSGRILAQELLKYSRAAEAETVMAKVVATGGTGEDWLGLGVAQVANTNWEKAEGTLRGAQNLLPKSPLPSLHLAKVYKGKEDFAQERAQVERAIGIDPNYVDAWAYLFNSVKEQRGEEAAIAELTQLADVGPNKSSAAPWIAMQSFYSSDKDTLDTAIKYSAIAVERDENNLLGLVCHSALLGQRGDLAAVVAMLSKHESKMARDVRLANNYFEALMQSRDIDKVTKLLNALMASPQRDVKQFAMERSRMVAQLLQNQQQRLQPPASGKSPIVTG